MLADPQTITVATVAKVMPRITMDGKSATYQLGDLSFKLNVSHQNPGKRIRSLVKVTQRKIVADPLTSVNDYEEQSWHFVNDRPEVGYSSTEVYDLLLGLKTLMDSAFTAKIYGQES